MPRILRSELSFLVLSPYFIDFRHNPKKYLEICSKIVFLPLEKLGMKNIVFRFFKEF